MRPVRCYTRPQSAGFNRTYDVVNLHLREQAFPF